MSKKQFASSTKLLSSFLTSKCVPHICCSTEANNSLVIISTGQIIHNILSLIHKRRKLALFEQCHSSTFCLFSATKKRTEDETKQREDVLILLLLLVLQNKILLIPEVSVIVGGSNAERTKTFSALFPSSVKLDRPLALQILPSHDKSHCCPFLRIQEHPLDPTDHSDIACYLWEWLARNFCEINKQGIRGRALPCCYPFPPISLFPAPNHGDSIKLTWAIAVDKSIFSMNLSNHILKSYLTCWLLTCFVVKKSTN